MHGDHKVVVESVCAYCVLGWNGVRELGKPLGELSGDVIGRRVKKNDDDDDDDIFEWGSSITMRGF